MYDYNMLLRSYSLDIFYAFNSAPDIANDISYALPSGTNTINGFINLIDLFDLRNENHSQTVLNRYASYYVNICRISDIVVEKSYVSDSVIKTNTDLIIIHFVDGSVFKEICFTNLNYDKIMELKIKIINDGL